MARQPAQLSLRTLRNANGSATYTSPNALSTITAGVNYPVEVPYRSDELPDSTSIEVNLRPNNGVGLVKERHVESLVKRTLQAIIRLEETPRMMLQVTLQVTDAEQDPTLPGGIKEGSQGETYLPMLYCAVNAAIAGCLDAAVQMDRTAGAALIGIDDGGTCLASPTAAQRKSCRSLHVFAVDDTGAVVLAESEGQFKMQAWTRALELARVLVQGEGQSDTDSGFLGLLRREVGQRILR
jgi:exosome complex component RRP46